jgi:hypothetical protein
MMRIVHMLPFAVLVLLAGCGPEVPCEKPEKVVEKFFLSVAYSDTAMAYELIAGADRRILAERAERASEVTGRDLAPDEMIVPGLVELDGPLSGTSFEAVAVEVGDVSEVEITFGDGTTARAAVVKEAGCYRVPLGL